MNSPLRFFGSLTLIVGLLGSAFAIGCASENTEEEGSDTSDINGSLANAQACRIRDAYVAADVSAFTVLRRDQIPFPVYSPSESTTTYASFDVAGLGTIFYVELPYAIDGGASRVAGSFYNGSGRLLLQSNAAANGPTTTGFFMPGLGALQCSGADAGTKPPSTGSDAGVVVHPGSDGGPSHPASDASAPHPIYDGGHD